MKKITVALGDRSYPVIVGQHVLPSLGAIVKKFHLGTDAVVISNAMVRKIYGARIRHALNAKKISVKFLDIADSEQSKSQKSAFHLIDKIARHDVGRKIFVIALGGGVVGDIAGFVASIYKRGIPLVQVPTTLLAQIDSSIGGKTAIDLSLGKNLVGAFYQPRLVLSDVTVLRSLDQRQLRNGLAEAIKYGAICDASLLRYIERNISKLLSCEGKALTHVIERCSAIKARIVSLDERETRGLRTILNFGHTLGHGIETAGGYRRYQHGEAVALGMRMAAHLSVEKRMLAERDRQRLDKILTNAGLPDIVQGVCAQRILKAAAHDKKNVAKKNRYVLLEKLGKAKVCEGIPLTFIERAIRQYSA